MHFFLIKAGLVGHNQKLIYVDYDTTFGLYQVFPTLLFLGDISGRHINCDMISAPQEFTLYVTLQQQTDWRMSDVVIKLRIIEASHYSIKHEVYISTQNKIISVLKITM